MRIPQRGLIAVIAAGIVAFAGGLQGQIDDSGSGYPVQDWPFVGGDWASSRYSTLTDITTDTVDRLGAAWVTRLPGGGASRATPVIKDGVMYLTAGASVLAIDARTGETVWRWQASNPEAGMVPTWQGVGLGAGFVFVGLGSAQVAALRQDTGELVWVESVGSVPEHYGESVTTAPLYAGGKVFVGLASGDSGGQGRIIALEAATGETQWTFYIVPRPGEFGHDTWPQDSDHWKLGGGGVWLNGAADPDLGMVYFVTGNPVPMYGGELRKGDNLFTAAVLALDMDTGERRWHYQVVRHDLWDADIAIPPLLYDTEIDGQARKALAAIRADGYMFLFDRETGEPLTPIEERPVSQDASLFTAPTQPYPAGVEKIVPDCSYWRDRVPPPFELRLRRVHPALAQPAHPGRARQPDPDGAGDADVVQPANRLHLRAGPRARRADPALRGSMDFRQPGQRLRSDRAARVDRGPGRGRRTHQYDRLEAAVPGRAPRDERPHDDRGRLDVLGVRRRPVRGLRRPDRRPRLAVSDRPAGGATTAR